ncbi:mucoidy inhibitor MuiA family protein [Chitinophaga lutea]|uniref:Mucoidy inhibitor MuiA family protein n=1 Tax=Chitinophaga lutea TaxID=2488634 RepID=A0A3N4Q9U0_9BACT|nr:DUF4139 domain-containing protein [Chitinophaga lutea]RPE08474.1 mucoidy inhibitor MuiA family protein [Chitinophaga lutea]
MKYLLLSAAVLCASGAAAQAPAVFNAGLESATVFRVGAELTHKARVTLPKGTSQVVINNVANALDENSVQIATGPGITIMSATFARNFLNNEAKSPAYLKLEDSLKAAQRDLTRTRNLRTSEEGTMALLDKNQELKSGTAGTSVSELMKLAEYYKNKQVELKNSVALLLEKEAGQQKQVDRLAQQLKELADNPDASGGQLLLQVLANNAVTTDFAINYLTPNAHWTVYYDLRADNAADPLKIVYKANVMQGTGIDWKKVKLTLSTGNPSQNGTAPVMSAWFLRYALPVQMAMAKRQAYQNTIQSLESRAPMMAPPPPPVAADAAGGVDAYTTQNENQLSATFDIDIPYDIASNNKQHSVTLKEFTQPAKYKYYAVPKLDPDAFLMAEITEYERLNLLPGEANIIFENMYAGKSYIDPNATGDTLNLSVGRDKKVIVKREKITDVAGVKFFGNQKRQVFTYEIRVRNAKKEAINMLLKDQYPISTDKNMEVELLESSDAAVNTENGVLTWKLSIAPGETKKVRLSYSVKYPKDKVIANL